MYLLTISSPDVNKVAMSLYDIMSTLGQVHADVGLVLVHVVVDAADGCT